MLYICSGDMNNLGLCSHLPAPIVLPDILLTVKKVRL